MPRKRIANASARVSPNLGAPPPAPVAAAPPAAATPAVAPAPATRGRTFLVRKTHADPRAPAGGAPPEAGEGDLLEMSVGDVIQFAKAQAEEAVLEKHGRRVTTLLRASRHAAPTVDGRVCRDAAATPPRRCCDDTAMTPRLRRDGAAMAP